MPETAADTAQVNAVKRRGKSKKRNWKRDPAAGISVIPLELDVSDPEALAHVQQLFGDYFQLRRALQRQARSRINAYWSAWRPRKKSPKGSREKFRLTLKDLIDAAYQHLDKSGYLGNYVSKAMALHLASEVWETCDRNLFPDKNGKRSGPPRVKQYHNLHKITGRARSHTTNHKWETFRLVGSLQGHLAAYPSTRRESILMQPRNLPSPTAKNWWDYDGPLTILVPGRVRTVILPVRLPEGAGTANHTMHFLKDQSTWHKVDLVRVQDPKAPSGWRYYAHLTVLQHGYRSDSTLQRQIPVPRDRRAGLDANVSNISVASFPNAVLVSDATNQQIRADFVYITEKEREKAQKEQRKLRGKQRALDRSRRNSNKHQYHPSVRQQKHEQRRENHALPSRDTGVRVGSRVSDAAKRPQQAYRKDQLSPAYRRTRGEFAVLSRSISQAKQQRAKDKAAELVLTHGNHIKTEDVNIAVWSRLWGRATRVFAPGMFRSAVESEVNATGGEFIRVPTRTTALSQHCVCLRREKKPLSQRTHNCPDCGLVADRDLLSAALAACVEIPDANTGESPHISKNLVDDLSFYLAGQQEVLRRPTVTATRDHAVAPGACGSSRVNPDAMTTTDGIHSISARPSMSPTAQAVPGPRETGWNYVFASDP
jgi:transposase